MPDATLPPIPKSVSSPGGPVQVTLMAELDRPQGRPSEDAAEGKSTTLGVWYEMERRIRLRRDLPLEVLWSTLFHEQMHAWLSDTGAIHGFTDAQMEHVCDVVGLARLLELRARTAGRGSGR